ncbi:MAG: hypothetical protein IJ770_00880 [Alphaproteobacteria bacterium]|nr:hypothetical protein [Alphaproteobacteria bacterium]
MKNQTKRKVMQIGDFMLRNNQCSSVQTDVRAKGIFVNEKYYLDIDSMLKTPVSKKEALTYGRKLKMALPTKTQMRWIEQNLDVINKSLLSIGRGDCLLFGAILKEFWTRYEKTTGSAGERRSVLFLVPI